MFCKNCGSPINGNEAFCGACGTAVQRETEPTTQKRFCSNCGQEIDLTAPICPYCFKTTEYGKAVNEQRHKAETENSNGIAVAGFICSFFVPILGWVFGGIGLKRSAERKGKGKGFSIAALAIATLMFLINLSTY